MDIFFDNLNREETAYAINRSICLSLDPNISFIEQLISYHKKIFFDTHGFDNAFAASGYIENDKLKQLEILLKKLCSNFSVNSLAEFYYQYHKLRPFYYGNNFVIRVFLVSLSKLEHFKNKLPNELDFRNSEGYELLIIEQQNLKKVFNKICSIKPEQPNSLKAWPPLPSSSITIKGYKFLTYRNKYFVGLNGGLIEISKIQKKLSQFISKGFSANEFFLKPHEFTKSIFPDGLKKNVDGINVSKECNLVCLDIDHLTNLDINKELPKLNKLLRERKISILDIPEQYNDLPKSLILDKALARIRVLKNKIIKSISENFQNKLPVQSHKPMFFMSMGGIGSGKSSLDKVARDLTSNNFVIASIDLSRMCSDVFQLYILTNHHSDDYKTLVTFSYTLMGAIVNKAIEGNYHYFRDGSGIPYNKRNNELIKIMKDCGYETYILVAAAALFKENNRKDITSPAHKRILDRYKSKKRAVPWEIVIDKHINHPLSQTDASQDLNVDKLLIFDTMGKKGETNLIGFTCTISFGIHDELISAKNRSQQSLIVAMKKYNLLPKSFIESDKKLTFLPTATYKKFSFSFDAYQIYYRMMIITNSSRMLDVIQKGALNPKASGYKDLAYNYHTFHAPSIDYPNDAVGKNNNFRLRHQKL